MKEIRREKIALLFLDFHWKLQKKHPSPGKDDDDDDDDDDD